MVRMHREPDLLRSMQQSTTNEHHRAGGDHLTLLDMLWTQRIKDVGNN